MTDTQRGSLILVVIAIGALTLLFWPSGDSSEASEQTLAARISRSGAELQILNENGYAWDSCRVKINGTFDRGIGGVGSRETVSLPLSSFSASDGARLPAAHRVRDVTLVCETSHGTLALARRAD